MRRLPDTRAYGASRWKAWSRLRDLADYISHAADGMNELGAAGGIDLVAEQVHERIQSILFNLSVETPYRFDQRAPGNHLACAEDQPLQQIVFGTGKGDSGLAARDFATGRFEYQVGNPQTGIRGGHGAALDGSQPGQQFLERKRLRHVVVGAKVEPANDVRHGVLGCEHEKRRANFF